MRHLLIAVVVLLASPGAIRAGSDHISIRASIIIQEAAVVEPGKTMFLGDSITEAVWWNLACNEPAVNAGVGGAGVPELLPIITGILSSVRPSVVTVMIGVNDAVRQGPGLPAYPARVTNFAKHLDTLLDAIAQQGAQAALLTILPVEQNGSLGDAYFDSDAIRGFNTHIRAAAAARNLPLVDAYQNWVGADGFMHPGWSIDGVHPYGAPVSSPRHVLYYHLIDATRQARARLGRGCP
jgi:hypothetical protein